MCGVPQGSVIGPALWNVFYDNLLEILLPNNVHLIAFADDITLVAIAHTGDLIEQLVNPALERVHNWMTENGLKIAPHKTEAILLTKKWAYREPALTTDGHRIAIKKSIRYLGVEMDQRLTFTKHIAKVTKTAANSVRAITRLMPNLGGPSYSKRQLLFSVANSKMFYAAAI